MSKHTQGPLMVSVREKWPFRIVTTNSSGDVVFSRDLPCRSTQHRNAAEAMAGMDMPADWKAAENNARALADEVLRAAAPELLEALIRLARQVGENRPVSGALKEAEDAIAKATGGEE